MKAKIGYLIVGVAIGFIFHSLWFSGHAPIQLTAIKENPVQPPAAERDIPRIISAPPTHELTQLVPVRKPPEAGINSGVPSAGDRENSDQTHGLVINEENVSEMERSREQLRKYAYVNQTGEGWKVQILPEDKVFMKAGLTSGDLITFQSMESQLQNPQRAELAARMVAILNLIQR